MKRLIDDTLFRLPQFGGLDCTAKLLYLGLIASADDQGRLLADAAYLRSLIFPFDDLPVEQIESALSSLMTIGYIHHYVANGMPLAQLVNWWSMQSPQYAQPSHYPAPVGWEDHYRFTYTRGVIVTYNWWRKDGTRCPDTCDDRGNPLPAQAAAVKVAATPASAVADALETELTLPAPTGATVGEVVAISPAVAMVEMGQAVGADSPTPAPRSNPATGFAWRSEDPDPRNERTMHEVPSVDNRVAYAMKTADMDPRKFVGGLIPPGQGETAIEIFYEFVNIRHFQATEFNRRAIVNSVTDLALWRDVLKEWFGRQYGPGKINCKDGMIEWYKYGIPTQKTNASGASKSTSNQPAQPAPGGTGAGIPVTLGKRASLSAGDAKALFAGRKG
jgi:hypothetical protein